MLIMEITDEKNKIEKIDFDKNDLYKFLEK